MVHRTTGGGTSKPVFVSTLEEFAAAVKESTKKVVSGPAVVVVNGTITGDTKVAIGSNKTIIGLPGSGSLNYIH